MESIRNWKVVSKGKFSLTAINDRINRNQVSAENEMN